MRNFDSLSVGAKVLLLLAATGGNNDATSSHHRITVFIMPDFSEKKPYLLQYRRRFMLVLGILLLAEILFHLLWLPWLSQSWLFSVGGLAELTVLSIIVLMFWGVQREPLPDAAYNWLTCGLSLWLVSAVADIMDEVVEQPRWLSAFGEDLMRVFGMALVAGGVFSLMRHARRVHQQLQSLANTDELTGLCNRRQFNRLGASMQPAGMGLLLLDLDHFKAVNDTYGHSVGDEVLRELGRILARQCPPGGVAARLGGEEFAVLLPDMPDGRLLDLAEAVRLAVAGMQVRPELQLTTSVGAGRLRLGETLEQLQQRTDRALYRAKALGRNRSEWAD